MRPNKTRPNIYGTTRARSLILFTAMSLALLFLLGSILSMQLCSYGQYQDKVIDQVTTTSKLRAMRGRIYDRSGNVLAENKTEWRIFLSPVDIHEATKQSGDDQAARIAQILSPILSLDYEYIYKRASNRRVIDETLIKRADEALYRSVISAIEEHHLGDMVHTEAFFSRAYPQNELLCHVLGFTGSDSQGLFGLEYQYNEALTGKDGYYLYAKDANGNEMPNQYVSYVPAVDGNSIVTTIDRYIQEQLEYQINESMRTHEAQNRVSGIVMNVNTGAILAMATTNGFDCNNPYRLDELYEKRLAASGYAKDSDEYRALKSELLYTMWSNKAVGELYEPGSTFKIFTASVGLETGATTMTNQYSCTGAVQIGGYNIRCHKKGGHGSGFTFSYGLQNSCNPTMMAVAAKIGAEQFYEYYGKFGYLEKTGIDLPSEAKSIFHTLAGLGTTELATASFGQRFKVTMIQQLTMVACAANGGKLVTPYLVEQVVSPDGTILSKHDTVVKRQVISEETSRLIGECLEGGVSGDGGAKNAYVPGYEVAAKTGTSQKFDILDENGNSYLRVGSCVAFAPADKPELAVIIVVDEPQNGKYGSMVAAPYISALLTNVLPYLEHEASYRAEDTVIEVDNYLGMSTQSAKTQVQKSGLTCRVIGDGGAVIRQVPERGTSLLASLGSVILITDGAESELVTIPNVVGMSAEEANAILINAGLNIKIAGAKNYYVGNHIVAVAQSAEAGLKVARGTVITVTFLHTDDED